MENVIFANGFEYYIDGLKVSSKRNKSVFSLVSIKND